MSERVLLKPVQERGWDVINLRLPYNDNALEVWMHSTRLVVCPYCYVGVVTWTRFGVINATKSLVEEIIEAFVYLICLTE